MFHSVKVVASMHPSDSIRLDVQLQPDGGIDPYADCKAACCSMRPRIEVLVRPITIDPVAAASIPWRLSAGAAEAGRLLLQQARCGLGCRRQTQFYLFQDVRICAVCLLRTSRGIAVITISHLHDHSPFTFEHVVAKNVKLSCLGRLLTSIYYVVDKLSQLLVFFTKSAGRQAVMNSSGISQCRRNECY